MLDPDSAPQLPHPLPGRFPLGAHLELIHAVASDVMASPLGFWGRTWCVMLHTLPSMSFSLLGRDENLEGSSVVSSSFSCCSVSGSCLPLGDVPFWMCYAETGAAMAQQLCGASPVVATCSSSWSCLLLPPAPPPPPPPCAAPSNAFSCFICPPFGARPPPPHASTFPVP